MDSSFADDTSPMMAGVFRMFQEETKKKAYYDTIDYTVLSVAIATLGLILVVELIRHKLDHVAQGKPFFQTVLASVNSELATLGIVEFVVFLIQKYYAGLDKSHKEVFADVHFMLFYCALFNALQSVLLAISSYSVAQRLWVRTEQLELDHYIEIREEFERVDAILYPDQQGGRTMRSEFVFEYNVRGLRKAWDRIYRFVRYPILSQRHKELLVQVRFHDLRVHFLKANELPLQLKISDYLQRSLLSVLQKLAHISAVAWLLLMGATALVYFLMGIVIYVTDDLTKVGVSLTWIYLCSMIFFVLLSLAIYNKMKWIFQRIMRMKLIAQSTGQDFKSGMSIRKGHKEVENQSDLFWGGNPNIITVIIQFAQFGFALALSILLVFWDDINVKNVPVSNWVYIVTVFLCYGAFVAIMAQVIPRYTLCTNLGQLVNKKHLQETLGEFYLQEAERKRQRRLEEEEDDFIEMDNLDEASALSKDSPTTFGAADTSTKTTSTLSSSEKQDKTMVLANLVQTDTESLRLALPVDQSRRFAVDGDKSIRSQAERRLRRKAVSDGVALMRQMAVKPPKPPVPRSRLERKKSNSASDAILEMQEITDSKPIRKSTSGPSLNMLSAARFATIDEHNEMAVKRPALRSRLERKKSNSASDAILEMQEITDSKPIRKSTSGPSLNMLSEARFETIDEHNETQVAARASRGRRSKTPSSSSAPLPPLDETNGEAVEVAVTVDPLVGSVAMLDHPEQPSDSDDHSVDDIPRAHNSEEKHDERQTLLEAMTDYFRGPKYPVVSAVFGTLICFWVVGQRIEELLLATGAMPDLRNTFQFPLIVSFYWEVSMLGCFIISSSFVACTFGFGRATSNRDRALSVAGVLDVLLAGACLALLLISEVQRCFCVEGDDQTDCCAKFGSRSNGGVGNIEPITSIIAFRIFRFWVAKRTISLLDKCTKWSSKDSPPKKDRHGHGHGHGHGGDPRQLAVDAWKGALALYPEVVDEHGEFSTELLQKMLGVDASINKPRKKAVVSSQIDDVSTVDAFVSADEKSTKTGGSYVPKRIRHRQSLEAITAKDPMPVKISPTPQNLSIASSMSLETSSNQFNFIRGSAKVLRGMRRCDRKLLPLINTWSAVDVVMTKYEIVYFEAIDLIDPNKQKYSEEDIRAMEEGRESLKFTSGGKGLRLKDVAKGRKVVGHLAISDIDGVHVDRILPHEDKKHEDVACDMERNDEFWELTKERYRQKDGLSREARWAQLKEDRLMIHSNHGTLCFRFYSDLHDMEAHRDRCLSESERKGKLHKDFALLWCQSIGRVCRRAQLKQKLEHYGDGDDEELRDYLRVVDPKNDGNDGVMTKIHRRASSAVGLLPHPRLRRGSSAPTDMTSTSPIAKAKLSRGKTVTGASLTMEVVATAIQSDELPSEVDELVA